MNKLIASLLLLVLGASAGASEVLLPVRFKLSSAHNENVLLPLEGAVAAPCVSVVMADRLAKVVVARALLDALVAAEEDEVALNREQTFDAEIMKRVSKQRAATLLAGLPAKPVLDRTGCASAEVTADLGYLLGTLLDRGQTSVVHIPSGQFVPHVTARFTSPENMGWVAYHLPEQAYGGTVLLTHKLWISERPMP